MTIIKDQNVPSEFKLPYEAAAHNAVPIWKTIFHYFKFNQRRFSAQLPSIYTRKRVPFELPTMKSASFQTPSKWQLKQRSAFKQAVNCFNIQPPTGGADLWGPGPVGRTKWYAQFPKPKYWYYNQFMKETIPTFRLGKIPAWCIPVYVHLWTDPNIVGIDPAANFQSEPFTLHAEIITFGITEDPPTPLGCTPKLEETGNWYYAENRFQQETCCTNYKTLPGNQTQISADLYISPIYQHNFNSGLQAFGWDHMLHIVDGYGKVADLRYTDRYHLPLLDEHFTIVIEGVGGPTYANTILLINPYIIWPNAYARQRKELLPLKNTTCQDVWNDLQETWDHVYWPPYSSFITYPPSHILYLDSSATIYHSIAPPPLDHYAWIGLDRFKLRFDLSGVGFPQIAYMQGLYTKPAEPTLWDKSEYNRQPIRLYDTGEKILCTEDAWTTLKDVTSRFLNPEVIYEFRSQQEETPNLYKPICPPEYEPPHNASRIKGYRHQSTRIIYTLPPPP